MRALRALAHLMIANRYYARAADSRRRARYHDNRAERLGHPRASARERRPA